MVSRSFQCAAQSSAVAPSARAALTSTPCLISARTAWRPGRPRPDQPQIGIGGERGRADGQQDGSRTGRREHSIRAWCLRKATHDQVVLANHDRPGRLGRRACPIINRSNCHDAWRVCVEVQTVEGGDLAGGDGRMGGSSAKRADERRTGAAAPSRAAGHAPDRFRSVLHQLSQRPAQERRAVAGGGQSGGRGSPRPDAREGRPQAPRRHDASGREPPSRQGDHGGVHRLAGGVARSPGRRASQSGAGRLAPAEPRRIRQRHPRPARPRGQRRRTAAERHGRLRLRQQRRRALDHAVADVAIHRRGHQDQPTGRRQSRQPAGDAGLQGRLRGPRRRAAARSCRLRRAAGSPSATRFRSTANTRSSCA